MHVEPYLFFNGRCEEALRFYCQALGAELVMLMRYRESPDPVPEGMLPPGSGDKVMHATLRIGQGQLMASDGHCQGQANFDSLRLSLAAPDAATAERMFQALAEGGRVDMPLGKTFWSPCFGMVVDRFGVGWMVTVAA